MTRRMGKAPCGFHTMWVASLTVCGHSRTLKLCHKNGTIPMFSCQIALFSRSLFSAWVAAGVIGLAAICLVLIARVLAARERRLETERIA